MSKKLNISPRTKFGKLIVIKELEPRYFPSGQYQRIFLCQCSCPKKKRIKTQLSNLQNRHTTSCGCVRIRMLIERSTTHKLSKHPLCKTWHNMLQRCCNKDHPRYKDWGGRGIRVCKKWKDKNTGLQNFVNWNESLQKEKQWQKGLVLDRRNNNKNYSPENCRWVTYKTSNENTSQNISVIWKGKRTTLLKCYKESKSKLPYRTVANRCWHGWDINRALFTPVNRTG